MSRLFSLIILFIFMDDIKVEGLPLNQQQKLLNDYLTQQKVNYSKAQLEQH
jgi:hypothetical protein